MDEYFFLNNNDYGTIKERLLSREERRVNFRSMINNYHNRLASDMVTFKEHSCDVDKILELGKRIKEETGLDPTNLLFWHDLIGSTILPKKNEDDMELDTPNNDIERFASLL